MTTRKLLRYHKFTLTDTMKIISVSFRRRKKHF